MMFHGSQYLSYSWSLELKGEKPEVEGQNPVKNLNWRSASLLCI
jgi:hypothetical protein